VKYMWIDLKKIRLTDSNIEKMDKDMLWELSELIELFNRRKV
jgi:hypothetical protein